MFSEFRSIQALRFKLAASLQKKFGPILKSQETFPNLGAYLRMRCPLANAHKVPDALSWRSNNSK